MLNKKSLSHHLDWIIAIGIFMLYILFVIVTLKPGIIPMYKGPVMLDIVQDNLMDNVTWNLEKVPIFISVHQSCSVEGDIKIDFLFPWSSNHIKLFRGNGEELKFTANPGSLTFDKAPFGGNADETLSLLYSPELNGGNGGASGSCTITYKYGIAETVKGICNEGNCGYKINNLFEDLKNNYDAVKGRWRFPKTKEFSIKIGSNEFKNSEPPANVDVFVRQKKDFILHANGELEPVTVIIQVW